MSQVGCLPVSAPLAQVLERISIPPLVTTAPTEQCESCVVIPVRDEAELLEQTLAALANQSTPAGALLDPRSYEIVVLANNCRDDSAAIARRFAATHPYLRLHTVELTLPPVQAHVGRARQLLMDEAYRRLCRVGRPRGVIVSTDGDSQVSPHWLAAIRSEILKGADAVGGRILTRPAERSALDATTRLHLLRDAGYQYLASYLQACLDPDPFDPWPRHYQHYGASFAVTAEAYGRSGGVPSVRTPEDVALYQALLRMDARFRHAPAVRVTTSARCQGRASNGLSAQLNAWSTTETVQLVKPVAQLEARFVARRRLRLLWQQKRQLGHSQDTALLAQDLQLSCTWLMSELQRDQPFGLLWERVEAAGPVVLPCQPIEQAIERLRNRIALWQSQQAYPLRI